MTKVPPFMEEAANVHVRQSMQENPALWIEAARFASVGGIGMEERIATIMEAIEVSKAPSLDCWLAEVAGYSSFNLRGSGRTRGDNPDRPARAYYIQAAVMRLLELVEAPASISEDLKHFLASSQPKHAKKRADLQEVLICRPELSDNVAELAEAAKCSAKLVNRYIDDGTVVRMPEEH